LRILFWATALQVNTLGGLGHRQKADQLWSIAQTYLANLTSQDRDSRAEQAFASYVEGYNLYIQQPNKARQLLLQSHDLALELGDLKLAAAALWVIGLIARNQGDLHKAEATAAKILSLSQTLNDRRSIILAQILLGELAKIDGRYEEAEQQLSAAITAARQYRLSIAYGLSKLQMVYIFSGQFRKARPLLAEDRLLNEEAGYTWGVARNNICLGLLHLHEGGRYAEVQKLGEQTLYMGREHVIDYFICDALLLLAQVDIALGNYVAAQERLQECDSICASRPVGMPTYIAGNDLYWGIIAAASGETAAAQQYINSELEIAIQRKSWLNLANALAAIAFLYVAKNEAAAALETYELAKQHPFVANSHWFEEVVGRHIADIAATLPPESIQAIQKREGYLDLWKIAEELLLELRDR
jgi:tetratricopeptide (TPR) repeat protein